MNTDKKKPQEDPALIARAAGGSRIFLRLDKSSPRTPDYIVSKLKQATREIRIVCDYSDQSKAETGKVFQRLIDLLRHDIWLGAAMLVVDYERMAVTFTNNSLVSLDT